MWTVLFVVTAIVAYRYLRPTPKPSVLTHRLSDRDSLVVVQQGGQTVYVGLYSETPTENDETPSWYKSLGRN